MRICTVPLLALVLLVGSAGLRAAGDYPASLKAGDERLQAKNFDQALVEYRAALAQAANDTETGLALGKQAHVLASGQKDYAAAKPLAEKALALPNAKAVARVTALQALAECQMRGDKDFQAAAKTLVQALALDDVEWAQPSLRLSLGDCYRGCGQFEEALAVYQRVVETKTVDSGTRAVAQLNLGLTWQYNLKDCEKAKAAYATAVKLLPRLQQEVDGHLARCAAKAETKAEGN